MLTLIVSDRASPAETGPGCRQHETDLLPVQVAVVLAVAGSSLGATVGVGVVPGTLTAGSAALGRRAVGVGVVPGGTTVVSGGNPVIAPGVGVTTVIKPDRIPVIPQYARTFGSFSGGLAGVAGVAGGVSGYIRDQWENRDGSFVRGGYSLVDADGSLVVVEYSSDPINGFRVIVKRSGFPDYFLDSIVLGGALPGGYLPPFYSDFGLDYSDDYYGYDYDYYYGGLGYDYDLDYVPSYYSSLDYDTYAPTYLDTYDYDIDLDLDYRRRRRAAPAASSSSSS
ncbi:uncharacterized protein LOC113202505 isoform X1 [Frankliniella occidentalis]|uniref:Uncharacterized protein LOC113202505 isoform X1 n=1 Tax=Frankliniella occidentalis TaxID=133901 RepID=A0A9C6XSQ9_FRAOC|nr:uncharacterized protein LOC113202505 isoform X1 [Frankliniella occidentalis]